MVLASEGIRVVIHVSILLIGQNNRTVLHDLRRETI